jgi:putative transferase (TIGR04331 family)
MKRYLVTTADELSWRDDQPMLFLGEWCRRGNRKDRWSRLNHEVAKPFWITGKEKRDQIDFGYRISYSIATDLARTLNEIHGEDHSERYWNIIVLAWLQRVVNVIANRHNALRQTVDHYEISGTSAVSLAPYDLVTNDFRSFIYSTDRDRWSHHVYALILREMRDVGFPINTVDCPETGVVQRSISGWNAKKANDHGAGNSLGDKVRRLCKNAVKYVFANLSPRLSTSTDAFIISSFLPVKDEIRLQLQLGQVPMFRQQIDIPVFAVDSELRSGISLDKEGCCELEAISRRLIPQLMPMCYVEGYKTLRKMAADQPWPTQPKFIYTANNFFMDELFKVWCATRVEQGILFYVGQHGNNYGTMHGSQYFPEQTLCDRFFSWGWRVADAHQEEKVVPAYNFNIANRQMNCYSPYGGLLLVQRSPGVQWWPTDRVFEHSIQQKQSLDFFERLPLPVKEVTTIRLHKASPEKDTNDVQLWQQCNSAINLDFGVVPIFTLFQQSRLVVFTYDSTGMLETLGLNIPTLCFWDGGFEHLLESAKPHYAMLWEAGIIHDDPFAAADLVSRNWDDINVWWTSEKVQAARTAFCDLYSRWESQPVTKIKELLLTYAALDSKGARNPH